MNELLKELGTFGLVVAAVAWLVKSLVSHVLSKDVETHKLTLQSMGERSLESFKAQLAIAAKEHEIRFLKLHEKRAEVLQKFYYHLENAYLRKRVTFVSFDNWEHIDREAVRKNVESARKSLGIAKDMFRKNRLLFSKSLCKTLDAFFSSLSEPLQDVAFAIDITKIDEEKLRSMLKALSAKQDGIDTVLKQVECEFRSLLGAEASNRHNPHLPHNSDST